MDAKPNASILTYTGRVFYPLQPSAKDVALEDVAHALSNMCRFTGHTRDFYSVAEHSVRVSWLVGDLWDEAVDANQRRADAGPLVIHKRRELELAALLHDASEAYLVDLPSPVKRVVSGYKEAERAVSIEVARAFGVEPELLEHDLVKAADRIMLATEKRDLMARAPEGTWETLPRARGNRIEPWIPTHARSMFRRRFDELTGRVIA